MTNYTKTTDFAAKDALPSGNSAKIVKGTEIDTEFNNIATSSATKANANNSALTGTTAFETISDGTIAITAFVDEDNMASNSATLVPTQQSVKAYVDSQVTAQDLDVTDGSTSIDIDLDSESLGILGGTGIDSTASGTGVTLAIDSTVATLAGTQTLSNKTLSTPVVSGNLTTNGLVDGRDVATDGAKLDGIESGATADQTAAEIKTAYESNANTNAFTDADHSKLDGIEASADVTDTANVTAAGALMDSELTSIASVKALNQGVATTDSPTFAGITTSGITNTANLKISGTQGTSGQVLTSSGSGVSWADASGGIDTFNVTGVQSNRFYSGLYETFAGSTFTLSTTTVYYLPFVVWEDCTIDGFATTINGGTGNSGDVAQIAIYGPLPSSMSNVPHKITTSTFAVDSGYGKTISITPTTFTKGVYFYAIAANTSSLAIRAFETPKRYINYMVGVSSNANPGGLYDAQYSQNTVSTWPHTFQTQISNPTQANHHNADVPHFQYLVQ